MVASFPLGGDTLKLIRRSKFASLLAPASDLSLISVHDVDAVAAE